MKKIKLPEFNLQYFHLNVYNVLYQDTADVKKHTTVVAPDSYVALAVFTALYPSLSATGVMLLGDCVSIYPQDI